MTEVAKLRPLAQRIEETQEVGKMFGLLGTGSIN